ncbi:unnamed protein product [Nippostrongylus brasiliensis]|uniref:Uncharacterized protein n=1 Tax=Nippostrongylus brasiliensis TaxID=27835 RepID=A0A0N4YI40_NIPBR|nr:unnamed protein product [Nippostrongylus brasiliensis]
MLLLIWLAMSAAIAVVQLLVTTQPEWIVNGDQIQPSNGHNQSIPVVAEDSFFYECDIMTDRIAISGAQRRDMRAWIFDIKLKGLFALCNPWGCVLRDVTSLGPLALHLIGSLLFLLSALALVPVIFCSATAAPMRTIAHVQITGGTFYLFIY